jgi:enoyl-CoA hydratase
MSGESSNTVEIERSKSGVATITLNRPPVNAVSPELIDAFLATVDAVAEESDSRAIVLKGSGGRFCAGADITVMGDHSRATYRQMRRWIDAEDALERLGKPVICAIEKFALGGGAEIALACDVRIMGKGALFGFPEAALGLFPGAGGTQRLTRLVGTSKAFWLMATGAKLTAEEALANGLVNEVVEDNAVVARATELAEQFASGPTRAIGLIKRLVYESWGRELPAGLAREGDAVFEVLSTADLKEGFDAFNEKRPPRFTGN